MDPVDDPPEELHPARRVPVHQQLRPGVRLGQLRGRARQGAGDWSATTTFRAAAGAGAQARASTSASASRPGSRSAASARARQRRRATGGLALVESAQVRVHPTGSAQVFVGTHAHGQGHETTFAQIAADTLGRAVRHRSRFATATPPRARRSATARTAAAAWRSAAWPCARPAKKIVDKAHEDRRAHLLEASPDDIVFDQGRFHVKGNPGKRQDDGRGRLRVLRRAACPRASTTASRPIAYFDPPNFVWPFGAHICVVEVDPETGGVDLQKYVAVDDCGNVINPMIVEGQLHGGIAQGIAQALFEEVVYDPETGQLMTGSLIDYLVPTANEIPDADARPHGHARPDQRARRQGHRRGGHDRRPAPRSSTPSSMRSSHWASPTSTCRPARIGCGSRFSDAQPGRSARMIPAAFDYQRASSVDEAVAAAGAGRRDAKVLAGGHSLIPLMRLRLAQPSDAGRHQRPRARARLHSPRQRHAAHRRAHAPLPDRRLSGRQAVAAAAGRGGGRSRRRRRCAAWAPSAACWRTPIRRATTARWR